MGEDWEDSGSEYKPQSGDECNSDDLSIIEGNDHESDEAESEVFPMLASSDTKEITTELETHSESENEEDVNEDDICREKNNERLYIKKVSKSKTTKTGKCKKIDRVYNSYQFCGICQKMVSNFAQHLDRNRQAHASSKEVKDIRNESDNQKKADLRTLLRGKFNNQYNMENIRKGKGEILIERRPTDAFDLNDFGPCPKCLLWVAKR